MVETKAGREIWRNYASSIPIPGGRHLPEVIIIQSQVRITHQAPDENKRQE
jgi:hypothetical protein